MLSMKNREKTWIFKVENFIIPLTPHAYPVVIYSKWFLCDAMINY